MQNGWNEVGWRMYQTESRKKWENYRWLLGILPAFFFLLIFFFGGFMQAIWASFGNGIYMSDEKGWAYQELATHSFIQSIAITAGLAIIVSLLSGFIGLAVSIYLARYSYRWSWLQLVFKLPIGIPHLLAAYMLSSVFLQTGWYARLAFHFGFIDRFEEFPILVHDHWGIGVILAYLWKEIPFIILLMYPFVAKLMMEWKDTTKALGANNYHLIRFIIIPLALPLWVGGMWIIFAFTIAAYEIPALLGRTSLGITPVLAWQEYTQFGIERQPIAIAMNILLSLVSFIIGIFLLLLQKRWYELGRRL